MRRTSRSGNGSPSRRDSDGPTRRPTPMTKVVSGGGSSRGRSRPRWRRRIHRVASSAPIPRARHRLAPRAGAPARRGRPRGRPPARPGSSHAASALRGRAAAIRARAPGTGRFDHDNAGGAAATVRARPTTASATYGRYYDGYDPTLRYYGYSPYLLQRRPTATRPRTTRALRLRYRDSGSVRVIVEPEQARVYVDGYYAGIADDFDGIFQRLSIPPGRHEITVKLDGYRTHTSASTCRWTRRSRSTTSWSAAPAKPPTR